jgi:hypothetical protein
LAEAAGLEFGQLELADTRGRVGRPRADSLRLPLAIERVPSGGQVVVVRVVRRVPGALVGEAALAMHRHLMREAIRGHQRQSEVIRVGEAALAMHRHLMREAIRGHQRSSEAIRGSARDAPHLPDPIVRKELLVPVEGLADRVVDEETSKEARRNVRPVAHLWGEGVRAPS